MGTIKDRNGIYLTEAEDIKKWQEYTEELFKKIYINVPDSHDGVITDLESDITEWEVLKNHHYKQASGGDGILAELFQILKEDAVEILHSTCQQIWKTQHSHRTGKVSFDSNPKGKQCQRMFKLSHNCTHLTC